eukprot:350048-Chlamydomonas_euryale.AAC.3
MQSCAETSQSLANDLSKAAWERVEGHVREGALTRMSRMKDRLLQCLCETSQSLHCASKYAADSGQVDILSAAAWPGVPESHVLLQPHEVRASWREFMSSSNVMVQQALATQQANKLAGNRGPPLWAILAILVLGWNEFMGLLCSPTFLVLGVLLFLFGRTLYFELDVDGEMAKGSLPGAISLAHKIGPASRAVVNRTIQSLQKFASHLPENASRAQAYLASQASDNDSSTQAKEIQIQERKTAGTGTGMLKQRRPATTEEDSAHM